jgi:molybdate transport system substrate-binding protein
MKTLTPALSSANHAANMLRRPFLLLIILFAWNLRAEETPKALLIAAAADLKFALDDVLAEFRKAHPEHDAKPTYGSSGTLFAQIDNGAPFDLFLSADVKFPRQLIERGQAEKDSLFLYAVGHLVVWVPRDSKLDVAQLGVKALLDPSVRKIAIANPDVAPYGAAAVAALKTLGVHDAVRGKFVLGENIAQTAQFVQSGAADAGVISLSLALAPKMKDAGRFWEVPADAIPKLEQAGVIRTGTANRAGAVQFRAFLASPAGRAILQRYGFVLPESAP